MSEERGRASRSSRYFEAYEEELIFGEAIAFYSLPDYNQSVVVFNQLEEIVDVLGRWCGKWSEDCTVLNTSSITKLVGIWAWRTRVHILRKHEEMDLLQAEDVDDIQEEEEE